MKANFTENYYNEDYFWKKNKKYKENGKMKRAGFWGGPIYSIYFWKLKFAYIMAKLRFSYWWDVLFRWMIFSIGVPKNILDAGCGTGEWVGYCNRHGVAAEGFDFSTFAISHPVKYTANRLKLGSVTDISFP